MCPAVWIWCKAVACPACRTLLHLCGRRSSVPVGATASGCTKKTPALHFGLDGQACPHPKDAERPSCPTRGQGDNFADRTARPSACWRGHRSSWCPGCWPAAAVGPGLWDGAPSGPQELSLGLLGAGAQPPPTASPSAALGQSGGSLGVQRTAPPAQAKGGQMLCAGCVQAQLVGGSHLPSGGIPLSLFGSLSWLSRLPPGCLWM